MERMPALGSRVWENEPAGGVGGALPVGDGQATHGYEIITAANELI